MKRYKYFHTFAICAYKRSPYLETCIKSILNNNDKGEFESKVIICTSTMNEYIKNIAKKYNIEIFINTGTASIGNDWNFAYKISDSKLVTLVHQDDIYSSKYKKELVNAYINDKDFLIYSTSSYLAVETNKTNFTLVKNTNLDKIKRCIKSVLKISNTNKFIKKISIIFANPYICPSITYNKEVIEKYIKNELFDNHLGFVLDWKTIYRLSKYDGSYIFVDKPLICYRVHNMATSKNFTDNFKRYNEEYELLSQIWQDNFKNKFLGKTMAKIILLPYKFAYKRYKEV